MMLKLKEVYNSGSGWNIREVMINPAHIVAMREDYTAKSALYENRMPQGLSQSVTFTRIYLNSGQSSLEVVVTDPPEIIESKINNAKRLLKG
jgi:hypothetical protein